MSRTVVQGYVSGAPPLQRKVELFTAGGTFTPPAGVTYAIATIIGGGGASGSTGAGGSSSVAFAAGTITAAGGSASGALIITTSGNVPAANSGEGANSYGLWAGSPNIQIGSPAGGKGATIVAGGVVTAGVGITVTVGAGGAGGAGGVTGGTGLVYIEYLGY